MQALFMKKFHLRSKIKIPAIDHLTEPAVKSNDMAGRWRKGGGGVIDRKNAAWCNCHVNDYFHVKIKDILNKIFV